MPDGTQMTIIDSLPRTV